MLTDYLAYMNRRRFSPGTVKLRMFYLTKFAAIHDLAAVTHEDLEAFVFSNPRWSSNTQAVVTATLKTFYTWANREGLIRPNPARDLPNIDAHRRLARIASEEQIEHAIHCDDQADRAMVMLGAECGLRVAEIASLHRSCRAGDRLTVTGKGGVRRELYLSPELQDLLEHLEVTTMRFGWYFPSRYPRQHVHPSTAWRHITKVLESNPHSLRRRAGTIVYRRSGNDIRLAQEFLGHKSPTTTALYLEVGEDNLRKASALTRLAA